MKENKSIMVRGHVLTEYDPVNRRGKCSLCGDVELSIAASNEKYRYWRCAYSTGRTRKGAIKKEHNLLSIDEVTHRGVCETCGNIQIFKAGKNTEGRQLWRCYTAVKKTAKPRTTNMASRVHTISEINEETKTGVCAKCGPVQLIKRWVREGKTQWRCMTETRERYKNHSTPEKRKARALKCNYGITSQDYEAMYSRQGGKCAICQTPYRVLCVDHCHTSKKVRKLLCRPCNTGLGAFHDDPALMIAAIHYLQPHLC